MVSRLETFFKHSVLWLEFRGKKSGKNLWLNAIACRRIWQIDK
jgi:hypothetical protein